MDLGYCSEANLEDPEERGIRGCLATGRHWSQAPALHREVASRVDPSLNEPSMLWYLLRTYLLAPIVPALRSRSMRLARMAAETVPAS